MRWGKLFDIYFFKLTLFDNTVCLSFVRMLIWCWFCWVYLFVRCMCLLTQTIFVSGAWPVLVSRRWPLDRVQIAPILWTTERNKSLHVPVPPVWKSIIMIFQCHHVLFCFIFFWGWVGWKGNKPKYYLNCLLKLINN